MKTEVVHLIKSIEIGGAENQLLKLAELQARDRRVTILYFDGIPTLEPDFINLGIEVLRLPQKLMSRIRLINAKADSGAILHTHLPHAELFCLFFLRNTAKLVTTRHLAGPYSRRIPEFIGKILLNLVVARSKCVIAISEVVKEDIKNKTRILRTSGKKLCVIHYGFSLAMPTDFVSLRSRVSRNQNRRIVLGTISRLEKQKNLETLIRAIKLLDYKVELKIIGEGSQGDFLKSLVNTLELQDCVTFLGKTREVKEFLDSVDIFVLSSKYEGFGIVLVEAASRGKPILASNLQICKEVLGDQGAIFFNPDSSKNIAEKLTQGIQEYPMEKYTLNAREMISRFDEKTLIYKTDQVYANLNIKN